MPTYLLPISVVIPCFRCAGTIQRALESVLSQTMLPTEIIIVDDASDDDTFQHIQRLVSAYGCSTSIRLETFQHNVGAASARNRGWSLATRNYVAFLDADDTWHPLKLELQYLLMESDSDIGACGTRHLVTPRSIEDLSVTGLQDIRSITFRDLLLSNCFVTSSIIVRRDLPLRFPEGQRYMEDHRLWLELASSGCRMARIEAQLVAHHKADFGAGGLSGNLWAMETAELSNYRFLYERKKVSLGHLWLMYAWSIAKYFRRCLVVSLRRLVSFDFA